MLCFNLLLPFILDAQIVSQLTTVALSNWDQYLFYMLSSFLSSFIFLHEMLPAYFVFSCPILDQPFLQGALVLLEKCGLDTRIWI